MNSKANSAVNRIIFTVLFLSYKYAGIFPSISRSITNYHLPCDIHHPLSPHPPSRATFPGESFVHLSAFFKNIPPGYKSSFFSPTLHPYIADFTPNTDFHPISLTPLPLIWKRLE